MALPGITGVSAEEALLLKHLSAEPAHVDDLRRTVGLPIEAVTSTLAILELKGLAKQAGSMSYIALTAGG